MDDVIWPLALNYWASKRTYNVLHCCATKSPTLEARGRMKVMRTMLWADATNAAVVEERLQSIFLNK